MWNTCKKTIYLSQTKINNAIITMIRYVDLVLIQMVYWSYVILNTAYQIHQSLSINKTWSLGHTSIYSKLNQSSDCNSHDMCVCVSVCLCVGVFLCVCAPSDCNTHGVCVCVSVCLSVCVGVWGCGAVGGGGYRLSGKALWVRRACRVLNIVWADFISDDFV